MRSITEVAVIDFPFAFRYIGLLRIPSTTETDYLFAHMGRPSFKASHEQREKVKIYASRGIRHEDIAAAFGITAKTLRKHFRKELTEGSVEAQSAVLGMLWEMAKSGNNTTATIFYAKTRCGWREKEPLEKKPKEVAKPKMCELRVTVEEGTPNEETPTEK